MPDRGGGDGEGNFSSQSILYIIEKYIIQCFIGSKLVIRCSKRYSEFEALYEVIRMNFKNIDLNMEDFPSKYQLMDREETRRKYFQAMLNKILSIYCEKITNQTNRRLLSTVFVFMTAETQKQPLITSISDKNSRRNASDSIGSIGLRSQNQVKASNHALSNEIEPKKREKKAKEEVDKVENYQSEFRAFIATQFLIKFQDENDWNQRYLKIDNSALLIYRHKNENHFKTIVELYQAKIQFNHRDKNFFDHFCEKLELDNQPTFKEDQTTIAISHQYDYKKLLIKLKENQEFPLKTAMKLLLKASHQTSEKNAIQGVFSPIGKIFMVFHKLSISLYGRQTNSIIFLRINANGLVYQTKRIMSGNNKTGLNIKQGFMIPISNAFANIILDVIMIQNDGIIRHESQQKSIGKYRLSYADFFSYPAGYGLQKIHASTISQKQTITQYECQIQLSVVNYSKWTSIYADSYANQNDGAMIKKLQSIQDTQRLVMTVDRVLRVIGNIALFITAFWRNVYLFKYPIMGYSFFIFLLNLIIFGTAGLLFQILIGLIIFIMIYNMPFCNKFIKQAFEDYVFANKHEDHRQPLSIDTNQLKFRKWVQNLQILQKQHSLSLNGKLQKNEQAKAKKVQYWQVTVHNKTFKITEELPSLLQKVFQAKKIIELVLKMITAVINILEKAFNVFSWADYRKSLIIFVLLIFISNVANNYIFRTIGVIFCIHRLVKGVNFYRSKHYVNNRKLAIYSIRYIINRSFAYLLPNKIKKIQTIDEDEIILQLMDVLIPTRDQEKIKQLKEDIEFILGVYLDREEFYIREEKKNVMRAYYLIQIIESCEARLKLQWISGQQGTSDDFQELKKLTKEQLLIDLFVQSLLINFFLNVPSQLYTTFRPIRSQQSLKCEKYKSDIASQFKKLHI